MPKKSNKGTSVKVGNISNISGNINIAGGDIISYKSTVGINAAEIKQLFHSLYTAIERRSNTLPALKEDLTAEVKEIQDAVTQAAQQKEDLNENFLSRRFRNIARMAPDILDVVVAMLANPLAGMGITVRKIAEKAKDEIR